MSDLIEFLRARLDEDGQAAHAATPGPWAVDNEDYAEAIRGADTDVVSGGRWGGEAPVFESTSDALHIARHDPARVLAEVEAKRGIIREVFHHAVKIERGECEDHPPNGLTILRFLAAPYSAHPEYDQMWAWMPKS